MAKSDERVEPPENKEIKLWRYMDFTKLVSLLDSSMLYFARADRLGDRFEGSQPEKNISARKDILGEDSPAFFNFVKGLNVLGPTFMAINCWHMNGSESAAMWKLYAETGGGIAIQSTYARLEHCLPDNDKLYLGKVKYIDYKKAEFPTNDMIIPFFHKRISFAHEQEVRAVIMRSLVVEGQAIDVDGATIEGGIEIAVDLNELIERVHVSPGSAEWIANLVKAIVQKYGFDFEVIQSQMDDDALF